jgi:hypothetical protein
MKLSKPEKYSTKNSSKAQKAHDKPKKDNEKITFQSFAFVKVSKRRTFIHPTENSVLWKFHL